MSDKPMSAYRAQAINQVGVANSYIYNDESRAQGHALISIASSLLALLEQNEENGATAREMYAEYLKAVAHEAGAQLADPVATDPDLEGTAS